MTHLVDHAARLRRVLQLDRVADAAQTEPPHDRRLAALEPDRAHLQAHLHGAALAIRSFIRSEEHTSELQSHSDLVCRLLLEKKKIDVHNQGADRRPSSRSLQSDARHNETL